MRVSPYPGIQYAFGVTPERCGDSRIRLTMEETRAYLPGHLLAEKKRAVQPIRGRLGILLDDPGSLVHRRVLFLAVADGALGFWKALEEVLPRRPHPAVLGTQDGQRPRQTVLARAPGRQMSAPRDVPFGGPPATREDALAAYDRFLVLYEDCYPKGCECLRKDRDVMFTFYDFPAAHGVHLRTTNPIESTFATVRHRTRQTKGCGSRVTALTMVFKLATQAERHWRRLNSYQLITHLIGGDTFANGELQLKEAA